MKQLLTALIVLLMSTTTFCQEGPSLKMRIERRVFARTCTEGYLYINGAPICYTMELQSRRNTNGIWKVPDGTYRALIRGGNKVGWRIKLLDVPGRRFVEVHLGHYMASITGCTYVGKSANVDLCSVGRFQEAMQEIEVLLKAYQPGLCLDCESPGEYPIEVEFSSGK